MQFFTETDALYGPVPTDLANVAHLASRCDTLAGLRVALLGNLKPNCDVLLHTAEDQILELGAAGTVYREKASCSLGAAPAILDELADTCQAAVVALGD